MQKHLFFTILLLILGGCVSVPESVQLPENTPLLSYEQVASQPDSSKESMARWGGVIANIENKKDKTLLDVVYYPLRDYGRPILKNESIGRFRVYVDGFLDPMVYQKGRSMTFSGEITGLEDGLVGEHVYQYPTIQAKGYHLWEDIDRIEIETISVWPSWRYGWGYRGWHGWPHYQRHVITRRHNYYRNHNTHQQTHQNSGNSSISQSSSNQSSSNTSITGSARGNGGRDIP